MTIRESHKTDFDASSNSISIFTIPTPIPSS